MTTIPGTELREALDARRGSPAAPSCDRGVLLVVGLLMTLGVVMVYSASVTVQGAEFDWRQWWRTPLRQCVFAIVGFLAMLFAAHLDYRIFAWQRPRDAWWALIPYLVAAGLLVVMLIPGLGVSRLGARRAIVLLGGAFSLSFQPAEIAKVVLVLWLAALLTRMGCDVRSFRAGFLPAILSGGLLVGLTGIEDFGTAALMGAVMLLMLWLAGARFTHLLGTGLLGAAAGAGLVALKPYRWERLVEFFYGSADSAAAGYQVKQSLLAIGSGGWWGRGLGAGVRKYGYLPHDNNDFILAIVCEELGVVGGIVVIGLFLALLLLGWRVARRAECRFGQLLAAGITLTICLQAAFNVGVVTDSIPTKGISLPFVSAGGSGVVFLGVAAGLLASVGGRGKNTSDERL